MRPVRLDIRQSLSLVLLAVVVAMTSMFLLLVGITVSRQVLRNSLAQMARSRDTFQALERQRQDLLLRQAALLSELPSLKALMTTSDAPTIADAGKAFWQTSGSDLFALLRPDGGLLAVYSNGRAVPAEDCAPALARSRDTPYRTTFLLASGRLFEVATTPIFFSAGEQRRVLGYVTTGYEWNDRLATMIGRSPAGQVVFATSDHVIASTLGLAQLRDLTSARLAALTQDERTQGERTEGERTQAVTLQRQSYLATSVRLQNATQDATGYMRSIYLVFLQSDEEKTALLRQLDTGILATGLMLLVVGGALALTLAGTVTRPLNSLLQSTRQMERGESIAAVPATGPQEVRELRVAFERMHAEVVSSHARLIEGERQATIGRLATSISHDLRHYLSPVYANAEFLASDTLSSGQRAELLAEITEAARGMTDLLDAILAFGRTGIAVQLAPGSITSAVQRAVAMIQPHPDARGVAIKASSLGEVAGRIDAKELQRAVYNLLLNACQAARRSTSPPAIVVALQRHEDGNGNVFAAIRIRDNGEGVREEIAPHLFEPFVSAGKESGIGLGLALVKRIAEAHGGTVEVRRVEDGAGARETEFSLLIPSDSASQPAFGQELPPRVTP